MRERSLVLTGSLIASLDDRELALVLGQAASLAELCDKTGVDIAGARVTVELPSGKKVAARWAHAAPVQEATS